jgi:predicted Zn-dependent protease
MLDSPAVPALDLMPLDEMLTRLSRVLAGSPADETEIAWLEVRRGRVGTGKPKRQDGERRERTLLVRVRESGRIGFHRTGEATLSEIENALRTALAQARLAPPAPLAPFPTPAGPASPASRPTDRGPELLDLELAELHTAAARDLAERTAGKEGSARFAWSAARVAVVRSDGRQRSAEATAASLEVTRGSGPGAGTAAAAGRSLAQLAPETVAERARARQAAAELADLPPGSPPLVLSPEATAALIDLLNRLALSSAAFEEGASFLCDRLGQQVFHPAISLRDDGTDPRGLPFPFDLSGEPARPVDLIAGGVAFTPALDPALAARLGRAPTPHSVAFGESLATHLFLRPGPPGSLGAHASDRSDRSDRADREEDILRLAEGGLWLGSLAPLESFDRRELRFRAVARGVRRIEGGALGRAVPDLVWEGSLADVLTRVLGVGGETVLVAGEEPFLGAVSAPALAIGPTGGLAVFR